MTRAATYLRQSLDRANTQEGIDRQRERCRLLAELKGWDVVTEYVDNDTSASKPRGAGTAWHRLITDAAEGRIDVVIAVDLDRLLRTIRDLSTLAESGLKVITVDGEVDLTTADGEFRATMAAGLARFEVRRKSERQKRANAHGRSLGVPAGGRRAFGYTRLDTGARGTTATRLGDDGRSWPAFGHEPLEPEATAVRRGFDMLLAGATLRSIARSWNEAGLTTTSGHSWEPYAVRGVLTNPRYAGLVAPPRSSLTATSKHNLGLGDLPVGRWEPLVTPETWAAAGDLLRDPARRSGPGAPTRWLLSGLATCGVCGGTMKAGATNGIYIYRCSESPHLARKREDADHYIAEVVIERLSRPDAAELLVQRDAPDLDRLRADLRAAQEGERNVLSMVARGLTSMATAEATLRDVRKRIGEAEAAMTDAGKVDVLGPLVAAEDAREVWNSLDVDVRRAVVRALMSIEMRSPGKGSRAPSDGAGRLAHTRRTMALTWH
ncbi:MAG TPA: recombinase family protein [Gaiellaceae bacterium]|jgi:DNA invertase Pin-like site-specific DNA recombinase